MKKTLFILLAIFLGHIVSAQIEVYPTSQRYLFNEFNKDSMPIEPNSFVDMFSFLDYWDMLAEESPLRPSSFFGNNIHIHSDVHNNRHYYTQKYHTSINDTLTVYGIALPFVPHPAAPPMKHHFLIITGLIPQKDCGLRY